MDCWNKDFIKAGTNLLFKFLSPKRVTARRSVFSDIGVKLRATPPNAFNDPFEFATNITTEEEQKLIDHLIEVDEIFGSGNGLDGGTEAILNPGGVLHYNGLPRRWSRLRDQISRDIGVVCLSACWDDVLTWSHYAAEHHGLAIGFDRNHPALEELRLKPVSYSDKRLRFEVAEFRENGDILIRGSHIEASIYVKSQDWSYEHEWRGTFPLQQDKKVTLVDIPSKAIPVILIGWRASDRTFRRVVRLTSQWPTKPMILEMCPHWTENRLDYRQFKANDLDERLSRDTRRKIRKDDLTVALISGLVQAKASYIRDCAYEMER